MPSFRAAVFAALPLLLLVFSGCLGGAEPDSSADETVSPSGSLESTQELAPPASADNATGAVEGRVVNENAAPIKEAFVILVGSRNSTYTDRFGEFTLNYVEPGQYVLRVDAPTYAPLESTISITPSTVTRVNVTLVAQVDRGAGFREHLHDFWGDEQSKVLFDGTVEFPRSLASGGQPGSQFCGFGVSSGSCPQRLQLRLPPGVIVYPGTRELTLTATWNTQYAPTATFQYTPASETKVRPALALKSAEPLSIPVDHPMTDHGHQTFTLWTMEIVPTFNYGASMSMGDLDRRLVGAFTVNLVAHKGIVPSEPAHPAFWTNSSRITLLERVEKGYTGLPVAQNGRSPTSVACSGQETGASTCFALPLGTTVPPGTTRLEVVFETVYGTPAAASAFGKKVLTFRTAKVDPRAASFADLRVEAPAKTEGTKLTYDLKLGPGEADAFYQKKSLWMFSVANEGREREADFVSECYSSGCGGTKFVLTVTAVNDDFVPEAPV